MKEHIFLVGYRGAGKSTIGTMLAAALECDVQDTDRMVCVACGKEVAAIVAEEGWQGFRRREREALLLAASGPAKVVSTGGGAVLHQEVWGQFKSQAFVVWLSADVATLAGRLAAAEGSGEDGGRPSLTGRDIRSEIEGVLRERRPLYEGVADYQVDTSRLTAPEVVAKIIEAYQNRCGQRGK